MKQQALLEYEHEFNFKNSALGIKHLQGTKIAKQLKQAMIATYDFSVLGGAIAALNLKNPAGTDAYLPKGAVITSCIIDVITAPTSGGSATIALSIQSAGDLKAATAIASYTGLVAGVPVGSAATSIKLTADAIVVATVATAALTAGKINVLIEYYVSL